MSPFYNIHGVPSYFPSGKMSYKTLRTFDTCIIDAFVDSKLCTRSVDIIEVFYFCTLTPSTRVNESSESEQCILASLNRSDWPVISSSGHCLRPQPLTINRLLSCEKHPPVVSFLWPVMLISSYDSEHLINSVYSRDSRINKPCIKMQICGRVCGSYTPDFVIKFSRNNAALVLFACTSQFICRMKA